MINYKGLRIIIKEVSSFKYFITKYKGVLIIYWNGNLSNKEKSKMLHRSIKKVKMQKTKV
ncbi:hypothetical protein [Clostridium sulfidigenes]|uniref:hypothetical protein n=1 Tax=Clostridium sulfidigenes TaxID=318464 RepID=UPI003F8A3893